MADMKVGFAPKNLINPASQNRMDVARVEPEVNLDVDINVVDGGEEASAEDERVKALNARTDEQITEDWKKIRSENQLRELQFRELQMGFQEDLDEELEELKLPRQVAESHVTKDNTSGDIVDQEIVQNPEKGNVIDKRDRLIAKSPDVLLQQGKDPNDPSEHA